MAPMNFAEFRKMGMGSLCNRRRNVTLATLFVPLSLTALLPVVMKRSDIIDNANIQSGDVIVGLAFNLGKTSYEKGIMENG